MQLDWTQIILAVVGFIFLAVPGICVIRRVLQQNTISDVQVAAILLFSVLSGFLIASFGSLEEIGTEHFTAKIRRVKDDAITELKAVSAHQKKAISDLATELETTRRDIQELTGQMQILRKDVTALLGESRRAQEGLNQSVQETMAYQKRIGGDVRALHDESRRATETLKQSVQEADEKIKVYQNLIEQVKRLPTGPVKREQ